RGSKPALSGDCVALYAEPERELVPETCLCRSDTRFRSHLIPFGSGREVLANEQSIGEELQQSLTGLGVWICARRVCRETRRPRRFNKIQQPQSGLRWRMAVQRGLAIPIGRVRQILHHAFSPFVKLPEAVLGGRIADVGQAVDRSERALGPPLCQFRVRGSECLRLPSSATGESRTQPVEFCQH